MASHVDVVVLDENHARAQVRKQASLIDRAQKLLARLVVRVRLAGKDELHRTLGIEQEAAQAIHVGEQQIPPLVGGKPARKTDGERVGIQGRLGGLDEFLAVVVASALGFSLTPDEANQSGLEGAVGLP